MVRDRQLLEEINAVIEEIRPALNADGGDIELINVAEDGTVQVRLMGSCAGCPMSVFTM
ncbi:MAG: NifU family protein, partial [Candidatus Hadarchaeales archaeon]